MTLGEVIERSAGESFTPDGLVVVRRWLAGAAPDGFALSARAAVAQ
jgi:hypothetical protein